MSRTARAIVPRAPREGLLNWSIEDVEPTSLNEHEVLVRMVASGICHANILAGSRPEDRDGIFPCVLGHEGAGVVEATGSAVTVVALDDNCLFSFASRSRCQHCLSDHPGYCTEFAALNYIGVQDVFTNSVKESIIIGIDRVQSRREHACRLGATGLINTSKEDCDILAEVRRLTDEKGRPITVDTSGNLALIKTAYEFTGVMGNLVIVGTPASNAKLDVPLYSMLMTGRVLVSDIQGDAIPRDFIPTIIDWHRNGLFPIEGIIQYFPTNDFREANTGMKSGKVINPVIIW